MSFVPKRNKAVILVKSMHHSAVMDEATKKPEIILDYNMTKDGVDTCDKMCASYSVSRVTRRWPIAVFYILKNIAGINSWVIYAFNTPSDEPQRRTLLENPIVEANERASRLKNSNTFTAQRCFRIS